ncbi:MAG: (d)CMP kinase [Proteobacteria bacterium]|nr:(d)CMP kinase [Pseudomonadota bacterium]
MSAAGAPSSAAVIAIDGPAASGKGTLAQRLADHFGYARLDTGLLYRAVGLALLRADVNPDDALAAEKAARALDVGLLSDPELRSERAAEAASKVAAVPGVRAALLDFQRDFAARPPGGAEGAVLDGRDIGTHVCPQAPVKLFVTAPVEVRARRRLNELRERGLPAIDTAVLQAMKDRDARDQGRDVAPMRPADDAVVLDTADLDADQAFSAALAIIRKQNRLR